LKKIAITLATSLLLVGSVLGILTTNPLVHGQMTGTVCLTNPGSTSCPSSPASIGGTVGTQIRVSVFIQASNTLNGIDITLLADHTSLKPAGADLTGTVLPGPQNVIEECLGGVLVHGNTCASTDTPDTLHLAAFACPGCFTPQPTTGLLFTAIYNITAASSGTPLGYQTGCPSPTSVPNSTTCVYVLNGSTTPDPETIQTAIFTTADFIITANPTTLTVARGSQTTSTITLTSLNGFSGTVSLSTLVTPGTHRPPTSSLSSTSVTLTAGGSASITLTVSTTKNTTTGSYTVVVSGTSGSISSSASVSLTVTR
jgi:hypothetical protein